MHRGMWSLGIHKLREVVGKWRARRKVGFGEGQKAPHWGVCDTGDTGGEAVVQQWHQLGTEHSLPGEKAPSFTLRHYSCCFMVLTLPQLFVGRLLPDGSQMALGPV